MKYFCKPARSALVAALAIGIGLPASAQLGSALDQGERATRQAASVQTQINQVDDERTDLIGEYRSLLQRRDAANLRASQLRAVVENQREDLATIEEQLGRVDEIVEQATPMLYEMVDRIEEFVNADLPFRIEARRDAIAELREILVDPDVNDAARYSKIMEVYSNELEYGRKVDSWDQRMDVDGEEVLMELFLYGRIAYVRVYPGRTRADRWDRSTQSWVPVDSRYLRDFIQGIRMAEGKAPPEIVYGPVQLFSVN